MRQRHQRRRTGLLGGRWPCLFLLLLCSPIDSSIAAESMRKLSQADFLHSDSLSIPDRHDGRWIQVQLPD